MGARQRARFYAFRQGVGLSFLLAAVAVMLGSFYWNEITSFVLAHVRHEDASPAADVLSGRSELWLLGLRLFAAQPLLGYGIGSSQSIVSQYEWLLIDSQGEYFHNSYLTVIVETGVLGGIVVANALFWSVVGGARASHQARWSGLGDWPQRALPWALMSGALAHAFFETWILSAGNANMILMWTCFFVLQARAMETRRPPVTPRIGPALETGGDRCGLAPRTAPSAIRLGSMRRLVPEVMMSELLVQYGCGLMAPPEWRNFDASAYPAAATTARCRFSCRPRARRISAPRRIWRRPAGPSDCGRKMRCGVLLPRAGTLEP